MEQTCEAQGPAIIARCEAGRCLGRLKQRSMRVRCLQAAASCGAMTLRVLLDGMTAVASMVAMVSLTGSAWRKACQTVSRCGCDIRLKNFDGGRIVRAERKTDRLGARSGS